MKKSELKQMIREAVPGAKKFTVITKTNRGNKSVSLTNTFDTKEEAVKFAQHARKYNGHQATVYAGIGKHKKQIEEKDTRVESCYSKLSESGSLMVKKSELRQFILEEISRLNEARKPGQAEVAGMRKSVEKIWKLYAKSGSDEVVDASRDAMDALTALYNSINNSE